MTAPLRTVLTREEQDELRALTPREVGRQLHLSERTIQRQCEAKEIRAVQVGRQWRIPVAELRRLLGVGA